MNQLKRGAARPGRRSSRQLKRQEKEEAVQRAVSEYETLRQDVWGPQGKATQENAAATGEVVSQIRSAVEKIAIDRNLNLVLDSAGGFIIYADRSLDLTSLVISELNTRAASASHQLPNRNERRMTTKTLAELAAILGGEVVGDGSMVIRGVAGIREAPARRRSRSSPTRATNPTCSRLAPRR